ncbi:hypothetical protein vseg_014327 [Gypsophila vaccaria]
MVIKRKTAAAAAAATPPSNKQPKKPPVDKQVQPKDVDIDIDIDINEESISALIEPFTKEQLTTILLEAAENHADIASRVRDVADEDTVHRKIFVHGLGYDVTTDALRDAFKEFGEVEDCKAVCDKLTAKCKGYGFVLYKTRGGAKKALKEPKKAILGRTVSCQLATVGPVGPGTRPGDGPGTGRGGPGVRGGRGRGGGGRGRGGAVGGNVGFGAGFGMNGMVGMIGNGDGARPGRGGRGRGGGGGVVGENVGFGAGFGLNGVVGIEGYGGGGVGNGGLGLAGLGRGYLSYGAGGRPSRWDYGYNGGAHGGGGGGGY